ncbi:MAG: hypothetical protein KIS76_14320 [Pyrinomonadaceae bacterium]|nr:hypothetical protein [Pyrinomonadaceae bacterium]
MLILLQIEISQLQAGVIFGALLGAFLGLLPLVLGIYFKRAKIGILGFIGAIIGNAILGLILSIPVLAVSIYLIFRKEEPTVESEADQQML